MFSPSKIVKVAVTEITATFKLLLFNYFPNASSTAACAI